MSLREPLITGERLVAVQRQLQSSISPGEIEAKKDIVLGIPQSGIEDLKLERKNASFNVREMTHLLNGSQSMTKLKEKIMMELERDPTFKVEDMHDLARPQIRERIMTRARNLVYHMQNDSVENSRLRFDIISLVDPGFMTRMGVHYGLFLGALTGSGTGEQIAYWLEKGAYNLQGMIGCFGMTELGHGSNVAGIETTATFDPSSDEFVIHTPTLTATKWWIGGAAQTATHCSVFAQLVVKGKRHGVKSFIVQLRDPQTYDLMPGVNIGDCGAKMGRNGIDNGWIQFTNVRIPRSHMLMKHTKVTREGEVKEPPLAQLAYGALIYGRVSMVMDSANVGKKALTIAVRYGAIRRQFGNPGQIEKKILDYSTHQYRLMPLLATSYAMHFASNEVRRIYDELMGRLETLDPKDPNAKEIIDALKETHATSAGLKAFCTWTTLNTIEQSRQACGGHGYSSYNGLASFYQDFAVQCTWEGDNTVLTLQLGRYLMNCYRDQKTGKKLPKGVDYLNKLPGILGRKCEGEPTDLQAISVAFEVVCANYVRRAGVTIESLEKQGLSEEQALEDAAMLRFQAAKMHSYGYLYQRFYDGTQQAPPALKPILTKLCQLYGLYVILESAGPFLQYGYYRPEQMEEIQSKVVALCKEVRKDAIPLVDAFNFTDYIINSPFGRYDGDVYRQYFDLVVRNNPPGPQKPIVVRLPKE